MRLTLKGVSQDIQMENPEEPQDYLVFLADDGRELRLPVGQDTVQELVHFLFGTKPVKKFDSVAFQEAVQSSPTINLPPELDEGATEFGAEGDEWQDEPQEEEEETFSPTSEAEIPSL